MLPAVKNVLEVMVLPSVLEIVHGVMRKINVKTTLSNAMVCLEYILGPTFVSFLIMHL